MTNIIKASGIAVVCCTCTQSLDEYQQDFRDHCGLSQLASVHLINIIKSAVVINVCRN